MLTKTIPNYISLIIHSNDMEPTKYHSLIAAAKNIGVPVQTLMYAHKNKRTSITRRKGGVKTFYIEWLER